MREYRSSIFQLRTRVSNVKTFVPKPPKLRPSQRQYVLDQRRRLKMAESAHAYVRGNAVKFYECLESLRRGSLPEGPAVWICGDCHVGNLGPVASLEGKVEIQIRDLDQAVIGNPVHDLIRLALSLATAARRTQPSPDLQRALTECLWARLVHGCRQDRHFAVISGF
jgi:uncharacterized protein (DUF2252 family)